MAVEAVWVAAGPKVSHPRVQGFWLRPQDFGLHEHRLGDHDHSSPSVRCI